MWTSFIRLVTGPSDGLVWIRDELRVPHSIVIS